jgi:hypothetical protein
MYLRYLQTPRLLISTIHVKLNMFEKNVPYSKFTGSLLKIYVCDVNKTLLSMKVKYVYVIQNRKYTGGTVLHVKLNMFKKVFHWGYTIQK